jgi:uncharacterized membrane protein YgcG
MIHATKEKDNGVLILHVLDQRRIEIETGYGLEGILIDVLCKRLLDEKTIPYFKVGAFSAGHESLILSLDSILRNPNANSIDLTSIVTNLPEPSEAKVDTIPKFVKPTLDEYYELKKFSNRFIAFLLLGGMFLSFVFGGLVFLFSRKNITKKQIPGPDYGQFDICKKCNFHSLNNEKVVTKYAMLTKKPGMLRFPASVKIADFNPKKK